MNAYATFPALTAEQWIEREIDDLNRLRKKLAGMSTRERIRAAARFETAAMISATAAVNPVCTAERGSVQMTMLWQAGRHALRAKVYRASLHNVAPLPTAPEAA